MTDENRHYSSIIKKKIVSSLRQLLKILLSAFGVKRCRPIILCGDRNDHQTAEE